MKKFYLTFLCTVVLSSSFEPVFGQDSLAIKRQPLVWFKAVNAETTTGMLHDHRMNNHFIAFPQPANLSMDTLNFQKALFVDSNWVANPVSYLPADNNKTLYTVYKPETQKRANVFYMKKDSTDYSRLTTTTYRSRKKDLVYTDTTSLAATINRCVFTHQNNPLDSSVASFSLLGTDSFPYHGKFAEFLYFDTTLTAKDNEKIHTYLAIKYGITLHDMHYRSSRNKVLWNHKENNDFRFSIAGIGRDDSLDISQKQNSGKEGTSPLTISFGNPRPLNSLNTTLIPDHNFLLWGHNDKPFRVNTDTSNLQEVNYLTHRKWKLITRGDSIRNIPTTVAIEANGIDSNCTVKLVISDSATFDTTSSNIIQADSVDNHHYYFRNITWNQDTTANSYFAFQIDTITNMFYSNTESDTGQASETDFTIDFQVYPNPSSGLFKLKYSCEQSSDVQLDVYTMTGQPVEQRTINDTKYFYRDLQLESKGVYMLQVSNKYKTEIHRIIVQ